MQLNVETLKPFSFDILVMAIIVIMTTAHVFSKVRTLRETTKKNHTISALFLCIVAL